MCAVDLRKARCIQLQDLDSDSPKTTDKGPNLLVDSQDGTLYLRMWTAKETKVSFLRLDFLRFVPFHMFV